MLISEIIIGSNKLFNLVGFTITFLKLNVVIKSNNKMNEINWNEKMTWLKNLENYF
jgi:hypothetical protein